MCLTAICLRGSAMNNATNSQIFHVIIFYEPYKDNSSFINPNEFPSTKGPSPQELLLFLYVWIINLSNLIFSPSC